MRSGAALLGRALSTVSIAVPCAAFFSVLNGNAQFAQRISNGVSRRPILIGFGFTSQVYQEVEQY